MYYTDKTLRHLRNVENTSLRFLFSKFPFLLSNALLCNTQLRLLDLIIDEQSFSLWV